MFLFVCLSDSHSLEKLLPTSHRLILIAQKTTVYETFPTPLINRLEKHIVLASSVLEDWQNEVLNQLQKWVERFSRLHVLDSRLGWKGG